MEKNRRIYGGHKQQAQCFKDLIKQKHISPALREQEQPALSPNGWITSRGTRSLTALYDNGIFEAEKPGWGTPWGSRKWACFTYEATGEITNWKRFRKTVNLDVSCSGSLQELSEGSNTDLQTIFGMYEKWLVTRLYCLSLCSLAFGWNYINLCHNPSPLPWLKGSDWQHVLN